MPDSNAAMRALMSMARGADEEATDRDGSGRWSRLGAARERARSSATGVVLAQDQIRPWPYERAPEAEGIMSLYISFTTISSRRRSGATCVLNNIVQQTRRRRTRASPGRPRAVQDRSATSS